MSNYILSNKVNSTLIYVTYKKLIGSRMQSGKNYSAYDFKKKPYELIFRIMILKYHEICLTFPNLKN